MQGKHGASVLGVSASPLYIVTAFLAQRTRSRTKKALAARYNPPPFRGRRGFHAQRFRVQPDRVQETLLKVQKKNKTDLATTSITNLASIYHKSRKYLSQISQPLSTKIPLLLLSQIATIFNISTFRHCHHHKISKNI